MSTNSILRVDSDSLCSNISRASVRVLFIAPGVDMRIAKSLVESWDRIGIANVNIVLDVDAEIFRLGYGEIEALNFLESQARLRGTLISHQPGVRIGLLVADEEV